MTLFTGSSTVADRLAYDLNGRIKLEDAGFDWKILGIDVHEINTITSMEMYIISGLPMQQEKAASVAVVDERVNRAVSL
ncbi:hypothetical protein L1987_74229 [Smallanthus sonchifolius]|uniref:Uncharacterized protein n=1 Tax=Smallanthus sonchifolius TaxID=185202 RepID=A0ACB9A1E5_9ASTR|nr:hypothetical protein L1987_74229 [Smallanthus sonchifolius]